MRRLILLCLFVIGLVAAVFGFLNFQGLAAKGEFETILLDFREDIPRECSEARFTSDRPTIQRYTPIG